MLLEQVLWNGTQSMIEGAWIDNVLQNYNELMLNRSNVSRVKNPSVFLKVYNSKNIFSKKYTYLKKVC